MIKKSISLALTIIMMLCCIALPASAAVIEDITVSPMYLYTNNVTSTISISSNTATCKATVTGQSGVTEIEITLCLQKKVNGTWTNIVSKTKYFYQRSAIFSYPKESLSSGTYRSRTIAKVYKGTASETIRVNSTTVTI